MKPSRFFLDANAGIAVRAEVLETWRKVEIDAPGNPSAMNRRGRHAQAVLEDARAQCASLLGVDKRTLVFTSGATEANNLALYGIAQERRQWDENWPLLLASMAEHPAALAPLRRMQEQGAKLKLLPINAQAQVDLSAVPELVADHSGSVLLSLQWANNETGAVQPIAQAAGFLSSQFDWHCDAVQGVGRLPWGDDIRQASSFTLSGHKIGAPKGIGLLHLAEATPFHATMVGGGQQNNRRSGTESPALAAAFVHALELSLQEQEMRHAHDLALREIFLHALHEESFPMQENHPQEGGLANTLNFSFEGIDGRLLLPALDAEGLDVASGSACSSGAAQASQVLRACGLSEELARASIRLSFEANWSLEEAKNAAERMILVLQRIYKVAKR